MHCLIALMWSAVLQQRLHEPICSPQSALLSWKEKCAAVEGSRNDVRAGTGTVLWCSNALCVTQKFVALFNTLPLESVLGVTFEALF